MTDFDSRRCVSCGAKSWGKRCRDCYERKIPRRRRITSRHNTKWDVQQENVQVKVMYNEKRIYD